MRKRTELTAMALLALLTLGTPATALAGGECTSDSDCEKGYVCDLDLAICGRPCETNDDCTEDGRVCHPDMVCVPCTFDRECNEGQACEDGACVDAGDPGDPDGGPSGGPSDDSGGCAVSGGAGGRTAAGTALLVLALAAISLSARRRARAAEAR